MKNRFDFLGIIVLTAAAIFLSGCRNNKDIIPSSEYAAYIDAYTGGVVSGESTIRIELTSPSSAVELNVPIKEKLFSFKPSLKGTAYWIDNRTIEFVPEQGELEQGKLYNAVFELGKVMEVDKILSRFKFSFRVEKQDFAVEMDPVFISENNPAMASVTGVIRFCDVVEEDVVRNMLSMDATDVLRIEQSGEQRTFRFTFDSIKRKDKPQPLHVVAKGRAAGVDRNDKYAVDIPAMNDFKVIDVRTIRLPERGVCVTFSDPLSSDQDLRGLIDISDVEDYTYNVDGNKVDIYFEFGEDKDFSVNININVKNYKGNQLKSDGSYALRVELAKPELSMLYSGTILPDSKNLTLPFRAINLRAVDVRIVRIFASNVLMFMQTNTLNSHEEMRRSGRLICKTTVRLDVDPSKRLDTWQDYSIDLAQIIKREPGAIYNIELSFVQSYSTYSCYGEDQRSVVTNSNDRSMVRLDSGDALSEEDEAEWDQPLAYYWSHDEYDWDEYNWSESDDPCKPSYYMLSSRKVSCNVLASDLGVIVKSSSDRRLWVTVNNILSTEPVNAASIKVYNFQLQTIGEGKTDSDGFAQIDVKGMPFIVVVHDNGNKTYLRVVQGEELALTRFDVSGKKIEKGLKGYLYGERGVWRPGDTIHLNLVLHDPENKIPANHPVVLEMFNPKGQFAFKQVCTSGVEGFYRFDVPTSASDPTGSWNAYIKVGGVTFHKSLRVETVKPNRLKINFKLPSGRINAFRGDFVADLSASWLTGAVSAGLKAKVEMTLVKVPTQFSNFLNYQFNNPATDFERTTIDIYEGRLDGEGRSRVNVKIPDSGNAPGMLQANITCRVFESGGDASVYNTSIPFSPFGAYVGINTGYDQRKGYLETDKNYTFDVVSVNADGNLVEQQGLEYSIYEIGWSWWWEQNRESLESYINSTNTTVVASGKLDALGGKGKINFKIDYPQWGRYLIYVRNPESGHATGDVVYVDWPSWRGRSEKSDPSGLNMLSFSTDKSSYKVGESVTVIIPASAGGRALVSLENGSKVMMQKWVNVTAKKDTKYTFRVTEDMAPNFYIHISLLQPHAQTVNNLPIRMYGIVPVEVSDDKSQLKPVIVMPDVLRPETGFTISVKETNNRAMTYTLAVVDEGLLDLTNFSTPDPWAEFYSREALGIHTWDIYDNVVGAFAGRFGSLLGIGGDQALNPAKENNNRFKPVVKFLGPFTIKKGGTGRHNITLPMYVGAVRVMVVAGNESAFGCAEKSVKVRAPLMVLTTLPRVISVGERITMPVNVFAMEDGVKRADVKVEIAGNIKNTTGKTAVVTFPEPGDKIAYFTLQAGNSVGKAKIKVTVTGSGNTSHESVDIEIRNPNPPVITSKDTLLSAGAMAEMGVVDARSEWNRLEVSRIPSVDLTRRLDYLNDYSHYCTEQITSKAFPLLFADQFMDIDDQQMQNIDRSVNEAIKQIYGRQLSDGSFSLWQGSGTDSWVTSYVGNFLVEAQQRGYEVNKGVLDKWKTYQRKVARSWTHKPRAGDWYYYQDDVQQAYRLYTLAVASTPDAGAMNRMKESSGLSVQAKWRLAATYAVNGQSKAASEIVWNAATGVEQYASGGYTYGSYDRDQAMILETLVLMGDMPRAMKQAIKVSANLASDNYFSTQSTAFSLIGMGRLASKVEKGDIKLGWSVGGKAQKDIVSGKTLYRTDIRIDRGSVAVTNKGRGDLYVSLVSKYVPLVDALPYSESNIRLEIAYTDQQGAKLNVANLNQGTDFTAYIKVSNIGTADYTNLALTNIVPSGWEIFNERLSSPEDTAEDGVNYIYKDIRDDRVLTYFDLRRDETKIFKVRLQAAYLGRFILPAVLCEAMYDTSVRARTAASWVEVVR